MIQNTEGECILDYRNRTRTSSNPIPQFFNKRVVFQSYKSFQQKNQQIRKEIPMFVISNIKTNSINAIGGESYLFSENSYFYTNSVHCYNDCIFNGNKNCKKIDYNKDQIKLGPIDTVINMSKLNLNIIKQVNNSSSNKLIIINCKHKDFWRKIKHLSNYKLVIRKKIIDDITGFFITVNILVRKSFVSLGSNCSVTHTLKKLKLKTMAFPFDWSEIKLNQVINLLKNKFDMIDNITITKYSDNHKSYLVKNNYMKFAHEVLDKNSLEDFKSSLLKRVKRFRELKNPTFVRIETFNFKNKTTYVEYWNKLIRILDEMFTNYQIILISKINPENSKITWYPYNFTNDWRNANLDWKKYLFNLSF